MKKFALAFLLVLPFIFTGCTSYSITKYFDKDEFYNKAVQFTKKTDIKQGQNVIAMLNVTYLNSVSSDFNNDKENFIVGVYIVNNGKEKSFDHKDYVLLLNEKKAQSIKKLDNKNPIYNNLPLKNHWADYYMISFEKEEVELFSEEKHELLLSYENILQRAKFLAQKEEEDKGNEMLSLLDEVPESTATQSMKASVTFLKEL